LVDGSLSFVRTSHCDEGIALASVVGVSYASARTKLLFHLLSGDALPHAVDEESVPHDDVLVVGGISRNILSTM